MWLRWINPPTTTWLRTMMTTIARIVTRKLFVDISFDGPIHRVPATLLSLITVLTLYPAIATAGEVCPGRWSHLMIYAGSDETNQLLDEPKVSTALKALMGSELNHLRHNLDVRGAADLRGCDLVLEGNAPHAGGEENGIVSISLYSGTVAAAILSGGRITIYQNDSNYAAVPIGIKDWLAVVATGFNYRFAPPKGATLVTPVHKGQ